MFSNIRIDPQTANATLHQELDSILGKGKPGLAIIDTRVERPQRFVQLAREERGTLTLGMNYVPKYPLESETVIYPRKFLAHITPDGAQTPSPTHPEDGKTYQQTLHSVMNAIKRKDYIKAAVITDGDGCMILQGDTKHLVHAELSPYFRARFLNDFRLSAKEATADTALPKIALLINPDGATFSGEIPSCAGDKSKPFHLKNDGQYHGIQTEQQRRWADGFLLNLVAKNSHC